MRTPQIYITCFTGNSGLTDYSISLCKTLANSPNLTVKLLTSASLYQAYPKDLLTFPSVPVFRRTRHYPIDIVRFVRLLVRDSPDLLLFQSYLKYPLIETFLILLLKHFLSLKICLTIHDVQPHYPKPWSKLTHKLYFSSFDKLIVHSQRTMEALKGMGVKVPAVVIPHGVYDIFNMNGLTKEMARSCLPKLDETHFVILFFGHIETRKGIFAFLEAAEILKRERKTLFIVAGPNDLSSTENVTLQSYKGLDNTIIHDHRIHFEDVQTYFSAADVIALPYLEGTTSGVLKLAIAFGKPVVVTDVGDIGETMVTGGGIIINADEEKLGERLAESVIRLKEHYDDYERKARDEMEKFSWQKIGSMYCEYLDIRPSSK